LERLNAGLPTAVRFCSLQDVGDRTEALAFDIGAADREHRLGRFHIDLADARPGDLDAVQRGRRGVLGEDGGGSQASGAGNQGKADRLPQRGGG